MYTLVKGTHDIILKEASKYSYVEGLLQKIAESFGYKEFRTPIIENTELFARSSGESSDIVRKEMYTFMDKGDRSISLRPEGTAGVIRCMVNEKVFINQDYPVKAFYCGPNFRYERPQKGRFRQFNQFGVECCGVTSPYRDAETIILGYDSLMFLGFKNLTLKINSLGDDETRTNYCNALREYFKKYVDNMCDDCKERYKTNVLRILDCKVDEDRKIIENAPKIQDFYSDATKDSFNKIQEFLKLQNIPFEIDDTLVRGLDYYSGVVFEYHYTTKSGLNVGAIGAGGHYGKLIPELGGPNIEGVGFAIGIERVVSVLEDDNLLDNHDDPLDTYIMPIGENNFSKALEIANYLRVNGYSSDVCLENKGVGQMFKKAERRDALYALILGDDEVKNNTINLKNLTSQEQKNIKLDDLLKTLDHLFGEDDDCDDDCCKHE
ncbi:MAG: histidine--tRNA ligase [Bacilli bacterium]